MRITVTINQDDDKDYVFQIGTKRINENVFPRKLYYINGDETNDLVLFNILRRLGIEWY